MTNLIRRGANNTLRVISESTAGFPAGDVARKKLGAEAVREAPAEALDREGLAEDAIVVFRAGGALAARLCRLLGYRPPRALPAGGYHLDVVRHHNARFLVVIGGDLFGMLAGLADALLNGELTREGFVYRGGRRTEIPAFPLRYYWTADHSTNWVLDDPGLSYAGCNNQYTKRPETFVEDYRRLIDHCLDMRFNGVVIWCFLRDSHGGVAAAYEVARYAAERGVALLPGVGTTGYGGVYYDGDHPFNIETYLRRHPRFGNQSENGRRSGSTLSPYCRENQDFIAAAVEWLFRTFPVGGCNMENMDLMVDYSPAGKRARARLKTGESDHYKDQYFAYKTALEVADRLAPNGWHCHATYTGFHTGSSAPGGYDMGAVPYFATRMPKSALAQWTISQMVSQEVIPLRQWRESPRPAAAYRNPHWPEGVRPPTPRSTAFMHQASQWFSPTRRTDVAISSMAEGCLRSHEAGFEGISVHGEVSARHPAWRLNYLAMRHWTYHPVSTLEEFAQAELAPRVGGADAARTFIDVLIALEEGKTGLELEKKIVPSAGACAGNPHRRHPPVRLGDLNNYNLWLALKEWNCVRDAPRSYVYGPIAPGGLV
ncbi:MAG: hypothetical protein HYV35_12700 [Lentisphaerae bacterium]|nr:hypothetical protein [Lentisphaerota bacterium]